jgi:hypothetical protein
MNAQAADTTAPSGAPSVVSIPLHDVHGDVKAHALVDDGFAHLGDHRWYINSSGYAVRQEQVGAKRQRTVLMNREVMGLAHGDKREADHLSRDKLDNRRSNLRVATHAENCQNRVRTDGSSRYRGVSLVKGRKKRPWKATGGLNGKSYHLGYFEEEAAAAAAASVWRAENLPFSEDARLAVRPARP